MQWVAITLQITLLNTAISLLVQPIDVRITLRDVWDCPVKHCKLRTELYILMVNLLRNQRMFNILIM